ncbi:MAG: multicopper oxidase domain-containing protein [Candidatus Korobacteraceae bacterium]
MKRTLATAGLLFAASCLFVALPCFASAPKSAAAATANTGPCPRFAPGTVVLEPKNLYSSNGVLQVTFTYQTAVDANGNTLYCFTSQDGTESPTLHLKPGDTLVLTLKNLLPAPSKASMRMALPKGSTICANPEMNPSSVNVHYHGTNTSPTCGADEVIHTIINSGETFIYTVAFPSDESPGLYWYHPHIHGIAEAAVQGGASGAIIVDGIENIQPAVIGLPERTLLIRDNPTPVQGDNPPAWDISLNYIPIPYPNYPPALIPVNTLKKQFWRVGNIAADTILDVQLQYDGVPQVLQLVALDGVPTGSQDGTQQGQLVPVTHILIPPAGRAEFIMTGQASSVKTARFVTLNIDTGPDGDNDPARPIAALLPVAVILPALPQLPSVAGPTWKQRFEGLKTAPVTGNHLVYFSENNPLSQFFITADNETPALFDPNAPPAITTTQGSVEDWVVENRTLENHEFHIHQIHFLLMERDGVAVPPAEQQFLDTIDIPYWSGSGPYPSVKVRMDFRGPDIGDFVFHCHILEHEDGGMMQIIRVLPAGVFNAADSAKVSFKPGVSR